MAGKGISLKVSYLPTGGIHYGEFDPLVIKTEERRCGAPWCEAVAQEVVDRWNSDTGTWHYELVFEKG